MFLPFYRGCHGETVYMASAVTELERSLSSCCYVLQVCWPFLFGLASAAGVFWVAGRGRDRDARFGWWAMASLIAVNAALCFACFVTGPPHVLQGMGLILLGPAMLGLALVALTARFCRNWFNAMTWLILYLSLHAALAITFISPEIVWVDVDAVLIGGKLATLCSVFLILCAILQRIDGPLICSSYARGYMQLSVKSLLVLMLLGGPACAWVGSTVLPDLVAADSGVENNSAEGN